MSKKKLNICAVTTTRADYGIMRPLLLKLHKTDWANLRLVVAGTHLLKEYGYTIEEIKQDKLNIDIQIAHYPLNRNETLKTAEMMSATIEDMTEYPT